MELPKQIDLVICGGGTAGAALAGIVARNTQQNVVLLEAGPDYGALSEGHWPCEMLDASTLAHLHDWGYSGLAHANHSEPTPFERACVIGGCSAHNGCVALIGHRRDYDHWAELGNHGWDWASVAPAVERAKRGLRVRLVDDSEITPFQQLFRDSAVAAGIPLGRDMNDPDQDQAVAASPVNIHEGIRWNTAFGYLDPVRDRPNLTVVDNALVDRVEVVDSRAVAVHAIVNGEPLRIEAKRIVLSAGAYGSPAILLRSGIGPEDELCELGIELVHALDGVGRMLTDHPAVVLRYRGSEKLNQMMSERGGWLPEEQVLAKVRSTRCREAFDLHLYAVNTLDPERGWRYSLYVSSIAPRSAARLTLSSSDPSAAPLIDHGYLTDPHGHDLEMMIDGVEIARRIMEPALASGTLVEETRPGPDTGTREQIADFIHSTVGIYYHPACSCRMGPSSDTTAVVDSNGKVHGLENLYACDASIFPAIMRGNTNLPSVMVAEHLAATIGSPS